MKCKFLLSTILIVAVMPTVTAQTITLADARVLVDSCAYFPQFSSDAAWLLYSNTEASALYLKDLTTGKVTTVADEGMPGFDARFAPDGSVYYVAQSLQPGNYVYRQVYRYDPSTGSRTSILGPRHGVVDIIPTTAGIAIEGEGSRCIVGDGQGTYAFTRRSRLYVVRDNRTTVTSPAGECAGYLWPSVSPDGTMVMFEASGKGLYVCSLDGEVLHRLPPASMPVWLDNSHIVAMTNTNFGAQRINGTYLYVTNLDGTQVQPLTAPDEHAVQPMIVGNRLAYVSTGGCVQMATLQGVAIAPHADTPMSDRIKRTDRSDAVTAPRVFVNPGHGGHDNNDRPTPYYCYSTADTMAYYESDSNFKKGISLKQILESKGYEVQISRTSNTTQDDLDLFEIAALANHSGADMFLSIHSNATGIARKLNFPLALYRGWSGQPCVEGSDSIARCMTRHLQGNYTTVWTHPLRVFGDWTFYPDWGYKTGLGVLRYNKIPGMLSEGSFHDYLPERRRLNNDDFCWLEGWNQSLAIDEYFGRCDNCPVGVVAGRVIDLGCESPYGGYEFGLDYARACNDATVTLLDEQGKVVAETKTDHLDNGIFLFRGVKPGRYHVATSRLSRGITVLANATAYCNLSLNP